MIDVIGDSHSSNSISGWKHCENIVSHHIGPVLCYTFGKEILTKCNISNFDIKNNDIIIFAFGEIDCRCHIHKHITQAMSYNIIINEIVDNYVKAIKINILNSKLKLKHICIYNVVPPVQKYNTYENKEYPYLGSDEDRKQYVLYFNKILKKKCNENKWIFFDIYNKYTDKFGYLNKELSDGNVHINNGVYIQEFITNTLM